MSSTRQDVRKSFTDATPFYAMVGMSDLAIAKLREMGSKAASDASKAANEAEKTMGELPARANSDVQKVVDGAKQVPSLALNQTLEMIAKAQEDYADLAARGHRVIKKGRANQPSPRELLQQAEDTLDKGREVTMKRAEKTLEMGRDTAEKYRDEAIDTMKHWREDPRSVVRELRSDAYGTMRFVRREADHALHEAEHFAGDMVEAMRHPQMPALRSMPKRRSPNEPKPKPRRVRVSRTAKTDVAAKPAASPTNKAGARKAPVKRTATAAAAPRKRAAKVTAPVAPES